MRASDVTNHGNAGYRQGCRCDVCSAAHRERMRAYHDRKRRDAEAEAIAQAEALAWSVRRQTLCRAWDCERAPLANGYCRLHGGR